MSLLEARVEAVAREIWKADNTTLGIDPPESMEAWVEEADGYLELARAALAAADAVITVEQIAMAVAGMRFSDKECQEERPCGEVVPDHAGDIARVVVSLFRGGAK